MAGLDVVGEPIEVRRLGPVSGGMRVYDMDAPLKGSAIPLQAGLTWGSPLAYAGLALLVAVRVFSREEVAFRN